MRNAFRLKLPWMLVLLAAGCIRAGAQAPGVPICNLGSQESQYRTELVNSAKDLMAAGDGLRIAAARKQLKRASCRLTVPEASDSHLAARDVCAAARRSHVRIGWWHLCPNCSKWHLNLAGGYWLTADGVAATCFHVVDPSSEVKEGCLVALDSDGKLYPIAEVLAGNRESDACLVRIAGSGFTPLALNTNAYPGDTVYCYSDPIDHRDYFSAGILNRFYRPNAAGSTRINVSTDWAPGSSGSAVLDEYGNAIGHVSTISTPNAPPPAAATKTKAQPPQAPKPTPIVFHEAVSAQDVRRLIQPPR